MNATRVDDIARLAVDYQEFALRLTGDESGATLHDETVNRLCRLLVSGPHELGAADYLPVSLDVPSEGGDLETPEWSAAQMWLSCNAGEIGPDVVDRLSGLAEQRLWPPAKALLYRCLAHAGSRVALWETLERQETSDLADCDAALECPANLIDRVALEERIRTAVFPMVEESVIQDWRALLLAELHPDSDSHESTLKDLVAQTGAESPLTYSHCVRLRIGIRAAAALCRSGLAQWQGIGHATSAPLHSQLPVWEGAYYQGLALWQGGDTEGAVEGLRRATERNPMQTAPRVALATLLAQSSPEEALEILPETRSTQEATVVRATLLARLDRLDDLDACLHSLDQSEGGREVFRLSWRNGAKQYDRQEAVLRFVLAGRGADWYNGRRFHHRAIRGIRNKGLKRAWEYFARRGEAEDLPEKQQRRHELIEHDITKIRDELSGAKLNGDAAFFRAAAAREDDPESAVRDLAALVRNGSWSRREHQYGGQKLRYAAAALLLLGQYPLVRKLLGDRDDPLDSALYTFAEMVDAVQNARDVDGIEEALERVPDDDSVRGWAQLIAGIGMYALDDRRRAAGLLGAIENNHAAATFAREVQQRCAGETGKTLPESDTSSGLPIPESAVRALDLRYAATRRDRLDFLSHHVGLARWAGCEPDRTTAGASLVSALCSVRRWEVAEQIVNLLRQNDGTVGDELDAVVQGYRAIQLGKDGDIAAAIDALQAAQTTIKRTVLNESPE